MGRKFKLREKGNIFSGMTFYSYRKKKSLKTHRKVIMDTHSLPI